MEENIKKEWLAALRSGKYEQSTGRLRDDKGYCCLGVLCDIYIKAQKNEDIKWFEGFTDNFLVDIDGDREEVSLPDKVRSWAGLTTDIGRFTSEDGKTNNLAHLNDNGYSFNQIADLIEKHF
jgi:hypothetical protein